MGDVCSPAESPNIVLILADDMGFSDIGCYGSEIETPNLDRLAAEGLRFTQMYNCARCCPTRASMLTGLYPHQAGVGHMVQDRGVGQAYQGFLREDCVTLGEALGAGGYRTWYVGKWHVAPGLPLVGEPVATPGTVRNPSPLSRGFEEFYGTLAGAGSYYHPHALMDQHRPAEASAEEFYYTDAIGERAARMIDGHRDEEAPFFLHVCFTAPHWPLHALPADIERYRGVYGRGWDYFRTARHEELKGEGLLDSRWPISPRDSDAPDFFEVDARRREWEALRMAVYAAQVTSLDRAIGRILERLQERGLVENTLVVFLSDNGGCAEFLNEDGDGITWPSLYRHTAPPGQSCTVGNIVGLEPGPSTTFMSYDLPWANASNTPFRRYKHWVHEGGIATPMIVRWPATVAPNAVAHAVVHVADLMATFLDVARIPYPREHGGRRVQPLEGESFAPVLAGNRWSRDQAVFWEHEGNRAVRQGRWKLVSRYPYRWELYDMAADRTELIDLADRNRPQVKEMATAYDEWADRCGVVNWEQLV